MSWTQELYKVYEQQCGVEHNDGTVLLPVSHSTANAQIEVTLKQDGSFVSARTLTQEEGKDTIIPVSAVSGKRTGKNPPPHPFADKLFYLAGDIGRTTEDTKYEQFFAAYIEQLKAWNDSQYSHPAVATVYTYLSKRTLLTDLINWHVVELKEKQEDNKKTFSQVVRFYIQYSDYNAESRTWLDSTMYDCYIEYALSQQAEAHIDLCYSTGKQMPIMKNTEHAKNIVSLCANAKIISANDTDGFTYRGRFANSAEALSVSYDFSQKMHNALRWLVKRQSIQFGNTFTLVVWTSSLSDTPNITDAAFSLDDERFEETISPDTEPLYRDFLRKHIWGTKSFEIASKVMIMGMDATTSKTGRLSIVLYEELEHSRLLEQLCKWHEETSALRYDSKHKVSRLNSFAVRDIINCAYGLENSKGYPEAKPEVIKDNVLRILPCIIQGRKLPADIMQNLVKKASNPLAYDKCFRTVMETACGMIRKFNIDRKKGVISMAYDPNETDRSYLYGCLLAIADAAENAAYDEADSGKRVTNAKRYWNMFAKRPNATWAVIEKQIRVYMIKLGAKSIRYEKMLNEIMSKFKLSDFSDNSPLSPAYLLGYHHFNAEIYKKKEED
ncbi:MAG: type I-C CRISPR-associated protein Cas8c/Csd1 [Oscillospiraceae bacterium]|nr:type I-C CRISPR-associated protein Cas8c/Csd1 [Oscillospiraceae bacterium]